MQPERVGPYQIDKKIGAGGMGTVYLGRHADTNEEAAVKVLPASLAREDGFVARFFREIDAMKKLVDPRVVRLYESGVDGETYYYAMEYVDGETLTMRLRRDKRIPWHETIEIAIQICAALKAAHDAGIVHRDLKPSNLLIAKDGTVKLTDFGVAQVFAGTKLTVTGGIIGTAEYMSPEQGQGKRATKKSDLYSLGAVMYVMLTGRPPFRGKTTLDIIHQQRYGQFDLPSRIVPEIPHWLDEIVVQLMEKDPDKRFADAYVLMRRLQEVIRKVDLVNKDKTDATSGGDGTAPTVELGSTSAGGAVGGTFMRDLVRAELENAHRRSPIGELFNNTWFLVLLLLLLIAGGVIFFNRDKWFERNASLAVAEPKDSSDEAKMFLNRAEHEIEIGEFQQAEQTLSNLNELLDDEENGHLDLREKVNRSLEKIEKRQAERRAESSLRKKALIRAEERLKKGDVEGANRIRQAVNDLYGPEPDAESPRDPAQPDPGGQAREAALGEKK